MLLDIGANPDSTAENLAQYARMGAIFSERVLGVARPRVALLSIGEEKGKGDARIQRATELLDATDLRFEGNVEGKDLTRHLADVVVCDAVLGNVVIKFFEGLSTFMADLWREEFTGSLRGQLAALLMRPGIARIRGVFDYERVGGSPLLGVRGTVIITHGRARRRMVGFACEVAATMARTGVPALIAEALASTRSRRRERAAADAGRRRAHERSRREPTRADRSAGRHRRPRPRRRARGQGRRARRSRWTGVAPAMGGRPVSVRIREDRVVVRLWIVARPGHPLCR